MTGLAQRLESAASSPIKLWGLNYLLKYMVPFNAPHGIKIKSIDTDSITTMVAYRKRNFNHIRGIHACCIATIGEFSAGLQLFRCFDANKYRLIMSQLAVDYCYQAKKDLHAIAMITSEKMLQASSDLEQAGKVILNVETKVYDADNTLVAVVATTWQIKPWSSVKTKR